MSKKQIVITKAAVEKFIRRVQETLGEANAMETSEFFMDGIEAAMKEAGIPKIKGYENPNFEFASDDGNDQMILFKKSLPITVK